jgi:hypothetical protein
MIKPLVIAASGVLAGSAAWAGPYANVEINGGYQDEYLGSTTDVHIGYEGGNGPYAFYLQGGPAIVAPNGEDSEVELSGKIGASVQASDSFSVYGELSFITAEDDPAIGTKLGAKYSF